MNKSWHIWNVTWIVTKDTKKRRQDGQNHHDKVYTYHLILTSLYRVVFLLCIVHLCLCIEWFDWLTFQYSFSLTLHTMLSHSSLIILTYFIYTYFIIIFWLHHSLPFCFFTLSIATSDNAKLTCFSHSLYCWPCVSLRMTEKN